MYRSIKLTIRLNAFYADVCASMLTKCKTVLLCSEVKNIGAYKIYFRGKSG